MTDNDRMNWKRYWCPPTGTFARDFQGFVVDPESELGPYYPNTPMPFEKISHYTCLVLLGEPGLGKSTAIEQEFELLKEKIPECENNVFFSDLGTYDNTQLLRHDIFESETYLNWIKGTNHLHIFLDSLDECRLRIDVATSELLKGFKQARRERLTLRLACRTAEWPDSFQEELNHLWPNEKDKNSFGIYELLPLTRGSIEQAVNAWFGDSGHFMNEVIDKDVISFAERPVTLNMLLNGYKETKSIPSTKAEIYEKGCRSLCKEPNKRRRESTKESIRGLLPAETRLEVASRIAAAVLFSNKYAVWTDPGGEQSSNEDVAFQDLCGYISCNGMNLIIDEPVLRETLNTGLFNSRGGHRMGFAHQTYLEYLAVRYFQRQGTACNQILGLIVHPDDPDKKLIPQLRGAAIRFAEIFPEIREYIAQKEPEILLRCDVSQADDAFKENLIDDVLRMVEDKSISFLSFRNQTLNHKNLEAQLSGHIDDKTKAIDVRYAAMSLAGYCKINGLLSRMVEIALDQTENYEVRCDAAGMVEYYGDHSVKTLLKPLTMGDGHDDPDDELKGIALTALWPGAISDDELFSVLTPKQDKKHIGSYHVFIEKNFLQHLVHVHLIRALLWVEQQCQPVAKYHDFPDYIDKAMDGILMKAWEFIDDTNILLGFAKAIHARLKIDYHIFRNENALRTAFLEDDIKRRKLLKTLIPLLSEDEAQHLGIIDPVFLKAEDLFWLCDLFAKESDESQQRILALILQNLFNPNNENHVRIMRPAYEMYPLLGEYLKDFFYVEFDTPAIDKMKENQMRIVERETKQKRLPLVPSPQEMIAEILRICEQENPRAWWRIERVLTLHENNPHYGHFNIFSIKDLPGWKTSDVVTQERIVRAAKRYVLEGEPETDQWFGTNQLNYAALGGYWALDLILQDDPGWIKTLTQNIWEKWAGILLGYSWDGAGNERHIDLLSHAYRHARDEFIKRLLMLIEKENREGREIYILNRLENYWDNYLATILFEKLKMDDFTPLGMQSLLEILLKHQTPGVQEFTENFFRLPYGDSEDIQTRAVLAASAIMRHGSSSSWALIWSCIDTDEGFGKALIADLADFYHREIEFLSKFSEEQIAGLYLWIADRFPYEHDIERKSGQAYTPTPREIIQRWRDNLLNHLAGRGTDDACIALRTIVEALPQHQWLERAYASARAQTRAQTWRPPEPKHILAIAQDKKKRIIQNGEQLLDAIVESLKHLQEELHGETASVRNLWNEKPKFSPKDESALSDEVKRHLNRDLKSILAHREVEIRPHTGQRKGQDIDVYVGMIKPASRSAPEEKFSVVIEVKRYWNTGRKTAMKTQLADRYLKDNPNPYGLYLVGWYYCPSWKKTSKRIEDAQKELDTQAEELSINGRVIKAFVMDTSIR